MGRTRKGPALDPATGKAPPDGVAYRGKLQYRARKLVKGVRTTKTFTTAAQAAKSLAAIDVDVARGQFVDLSESQKRTLGDIVRRYQDEVLGDDSEKRGAEKEHGRLDVVLRDVVCTIRMADLISADVAQFRDRMKTVEYAPATIVRRLNRLQTVVEHTRRE